MRQMNHSQRGTLAGALMSWGIVSLLATATPRLEAQGGNTLMSGLNPIGQNAHGLQLYDVTGFVGWTSMASPQQGFLLPSFNQRLGSDTSFGGGASLGWARGGERGRLSIAYTGGYTGEVRYSDWNAFYHSLGISASRHLSPRWSSQWSARSGIGTYNQMMFSPTLFGSLAGAPGTFDDLAAAVLAGQYSNDQLASLLSGVPLIESPSRTLLFGNRVFSSAGAVGLSYMHSQRLSLSFSGSYSNTQHLPDSTNSGPQYRYLVQHSSSASAGVNVSYAISPRTQIGVSTSSGRGFSRLQQEYVTSGNAFIGHQTGRHWFMQAHAGAGFITNLGSNYNKTLGARPIFGGELGYRMFAQTFMASYNRTLGLAYGVAASDTTTVGGGWRWWRPGHTWGLSSSAMEEQLHTTVFSNTRGWRGTFGITKQIGTHAVAETGYSYARYSGGALQALNSTTPGTPFKETQHGVRLTLAWYPQSMERR